MSGALLFRHALKRVVSLELPAEAERDVVAALDASRAGTLDVLHAAGVEAKLSAADLAVRGAALAFCYAAGQLADDLADGECDYLELSERTGPATQFMLQNLFLATLEEAALPRRVVLEAALDLVRGAGPQQVEVRTRRFRLETSRQVALGISGLQFGAYLRLLWWGTDLEPIALATGRDLGFAAHVAVDVRSADARFTDLDAAERRALVGQARQAAARLHARDLRCLAAPLRDLLGTLEAAA